MAETRPYRVLKGKHGRWEDGKPVTYRPGDTMHLTEAQARRMTSATGSMVEPLWTADKPAPSPKAPPSEPAAETEPEEASTDDAEGYDLSSLSWRDAVELVEGLDSAEDVRSAKAEEEAGNSRPSVLKAADKRLAELEG